MKSRPTGDKRRKELARQERQRDKAERRKARKLERASSDDGAAEDPFAGALPPEPSLAVSEGRTGEPSSAPVHADQPSKASELGQ